MSANGVDVTSALPAAYEFGTIGSPLDASLKKSWPARITAIGFIIVILAGNGWLAYGLMSEPVPELIGAGFAAGIAVSLVGGVALGALIVVRRFHDGPTTPPGDDDGEG